MAKDHTQEPGQDPSEQPTSATIEAAPQPVAEEASGQPQAVVTVASTPGGQAYFFPNLAGEDQPVTIYATSLAEATQQYEQQKGQAPQR